MTDDLDTRAQAAAAALHQAVSSLPVESPRLQRARGRLVLAGAAAVVAIAVLAVSLRDRGHVDTDVATGNVGDVPRLVLGAVPEGLVPTGATDLPLAEQGAFETTYWVYGDTEAEDPFAQGDLGVVISTGTEATFEPPEGARLVEIDGQRAWVAPSPDALGRRLVAVEPDSGSAGYLASSTLSVDQLLDAVGQLGLESGGVDAPSVIGRLHLVATSTAGLISSSLPVPLPTKRGHIVGYQSDDATGRQTVVVASVEGGEDAYLAGRWALGPARRAVEVRGTEGWSGSPFGGTSTLVIWRDSPTNLVAVAADGLPDRGALDVAASLRPATDDEWAALFVGSDRLSLPLGAVAGVGSEDDGQAFLAYLDADGSLCLDLETPDGSSGTCSGGDARPLVVMTESLGDGGLVVYGHTTLGTNGDIRITADGEPGSGGSEAFYEGGTVFAFVMTDGLVPAEIVVQAADGTELGRASVPAPGHQTGAETTTTRSG